MRQKMIVSMHFYLLQTCIKICQNVSELALSFFLSFLAQFLEPWFPDFPSLRLKRFALYIHTHVHTNTHTYRHACIHTYVHAYGHAYFKTRPFFHGLLYCTARQNFELVPSVTKRLASCLSVPRCRKLARGRSSFATPVQDCGHSCYLMICRYDSSAPAIPPAWLGHSQRPHIRLSSQSACRILVGKLRPSV